MTCMETDGRGCSPGDRVVAPDEVAAVIRLVRSGSAVTKAELAHRARIGRNAVSERLKEALRLGMIESAGTRPSTAGRAPETYRFCAERGVVLAACLGAATMTCAVTDLQGDLLERTRVEWPVAEGPEATLAEIARVFDELLSRRVGATLWGIGIGLPGPVDHDSGRPVDPPIMSGWHGFDIRAWFADRYRVGTWVDNDVNCMAIGHRATAGTGEDFIYVKIGTGIGAGLFSNDRLHRGVAGAAGDIGHVRTSDRTDVICRCGRMGCLESVAAGWALARDATTAAIDGRSRYLRELLERNGQIVPADVGRGSLRTEPVCTELAARSATLVGHVLAILVNFYNPSKIVVGGGVVDSAQLYVSAVERAITERANALATRGLQIVVGDPEQREGVIGCAQMVLDDLLSGPFLDAWAGHGSPHAAPAVVSRKVQDFPDPA